jgi:hypothetical protein
MNISRIQQEFCDRIERKMSSQNKLNALAQQIKGTCKALGISYTLDVFREDYPHYLKQTKGAREDWIEGTLGVARQLFKARQLFPSDQAFSGWLGENGYDDFNKNDRAALINMGTSGHIEISRQVLKETGSWSYQLIWQEIDRRVPNVRKPTPTDPEPPKVEETTLPAVVSSNGTAEKGENSPEHGSEKKDLSSRNPLRNLPRAGEIWDVYRNNETKAELVKAMAKRGSGELWELILAALDNGFLKQNSVSNRGGFVLRMLFPKTPPRGEFSTINLSNARTREFAKKVIMPTAIACREQILAEPQRAEEICNEYRRKQQQKKHSQTEQVKRTVALSKLSANQQEIIAYGQTLWPYEPNGVNDYDWDQVRAACWYFLNLQSCLSISTDNSPGSVALTIRTSIKYLLEYCSFREKGLGKARDVIRLVKHITFLWDANPEGRCSWPHFPVLSGIEGKWD